MVEMCANLVGAALKWFALGGKSKKMSAKFEKFLKVPLKGHLHICNMVKREIV